jgi:hypothetical protein
VRTTHEHLLRGIRILGGKNIIMKIVADGNGRKKQHPHAQHSADT